jgi:hypothetical protein
MAGWPEVMFVDAQLPAFAEDIQQDDGTRLAIVGLEDGLQTHQRAVHDGDGGAGFESALVGLVQPGIRIGRLEQGIDELLGHLRREAAEADQPGDAAGGADGGDVFPAEVESYKEIAREQRFDGITPSATVAARLFDPRQIDLECLASQLLFGMFLLPGFGMNGVPVFHAGCGNRAGMLLVCSSILPIDLAYHYFCLASLFVVDFWCRVVTRFLKGRVYTSHNRVP